MGSAAVANHALSFQALSHSISGAESPSTSSPKRALFQRTGLLALPRRERATSRRHGLRKRAAWPAATVGHALLEPSTSIDVEGIVAETPSLLALSSDFDWQRSVTELREEALGALSAGKERAMSLERLGAAIDGRLRDRMFDSIIQPSLHQSVRDPQEELLVRIRVEDLRWQATLQVKNYFSMLLLRALLLSNYVNSYQFRYPFVPISSVGFVNLCLLDVWYRRQRSYQMVWTAASTGSQRF
jgi:hypothetical protein